MTAELIEAARAVVDRWDTPLWKDAPATAEYINRLRAALSQPHASAQEAAPEAQLLFDFGGFLTSSERQWVFSSSDDAAPMVDAIRAFAARQGINLDATPPASPSEGGGEPTPVWSRKMPLHPGCEHACQQAQDYGVWPESSCRPTCAYLAREPHPEDIEGNLAASRGEAVDAARYRAIRCSFGVAEPETGVVVFYPKEIDALVDAEIAALQSQGAKP